MVLKKSQLYSSLWKSCDELRGGMDASQYKDYILTLLFVKYVSDKQKADPHSLITVPEGGSFDDMLALKGKTNIGEEIDKIIGKLAEANDLVNVIDQASFNDEEKLGRGKEMVDRLTKLVTIFADLDFRGSRAEGDDLLGDAYEYLMRHFATESGKSKGQFYTPAEVSRVLARIVGIGQQTSQDQTVYDPACGSGSLLLKVADEAPRGVTIYGQEKDNATWALAKMNMILHGNADADIVKGDTITSPQFTHNDQLRTFDFAVANPPFSVKSWSSGLDNDYGRFEFGRPPEKNGDYAFLLHILKSLKSTGKAAIILPHGVLFRGNAEGAIRKRLLDHGYIKGVIGLPANLFYGTGIPACVIVLDKEQAQSRTGVFMIDASKGFLKDGNKNRLRSQDIHKIVDAFNKQAEIDRFSRMVPLAEIVSSANGYNLNIPRYIDSSEPEDIQDLHAHLHGGIPNRDLDALSHYWEAFPTLRNSLLKSNRPGYSDLAIEVNQLNQAILDSGEFKEFSSQVRDLISAWFASHREALESIVETTRPNDLIATLGDDLLERFESNPMLDAYDVYEQLMTYWHDIMHDDVSLVMADGWLTAGRPRKTIEDKDRKLSETPDLVIGSGRATAKYKMDLLPPYVIVDHYFCVERDQIDNLIVQAEEVTRSIGEYIEEHAVEDGLLAEAMDDGNVTKALVTARLKGATKEGTDPDEVKALQHLLGLYDKEAAAKKAVKDAQIKLDLVTLKKYGELTEADVKKLVIDDKWMSNVATRVNNEVDSLVLVLVHRIQTLGVRYSKTVSELQSEFDRLDGRVAATLGGDGNQMTKTMTTVREITDVVTKGTTPTSLGRAFTSRGVRFIKVETIGVSGNYLPDKTAYIDLETHNLLRRSQLQEGDILFSIAGALGRTTIVKDTWLPANTNQAFAIIRPSKRSQINSRYLLWALRSQAISDRISEINVQAAQANLSLEQVRDFEVPILDTETQALIANALDDAENQISTIESLIIKKRAIKQGMMQGLLTGKTRLPGFSGEWRQTIWGDVTERCASGATPSRARAEYYGGDIPWVTSTELKYGVIKNVPQFLTKPGLEAANLTVWPVGTFLMAITGLEAAGTRGSCGILGMPAATNQSCMAIIPNSKMLTRFLYYHYLLHGEDLALRYCQGTKQQSYTAGIVQTLPIRLPVSIQEQEAIVVALSEIDRQTENLAIRLKKTKAIKQGMMQELLIGRTRLPVTEVLT